LIIDKYG
jgi:hypothetical protein